MPACSDRLDSVTRVEGSCVDASGAAAAGAAVAAEGAAGGVVVGEMEEMAMMFT
jgi:hypothetical protein